LATIGVDVCPHMFRTSGESSCAAYAGDQPRLGAALLHHNDSSVTDESYNRVRGFTASQRFADIIRGLRRWSRLEEVSGFRVGFDVSVARQRNDL